MTTLESYKYYEREGITIYCGDCRECKVNDSNWRDDYDFPMSWTFWRDICRQHGFDPGDNVPSSMSEPSMPEPLYPEPIPSQRLDQIEGNLVSLRDALKQHVNETRPKKKKTESAF